MLEGEVVSIRAMLVVMGLVLLVSCDDDNEGSNKPADNNHALSFIGDDGVGDNGKGKIELELKQGDKAVTDAAGTEVTLTIVCGENSEEFTGKLSESGRAEIEVDLSDKDWDVTDWSTCKVSAVAEVNDEEVEATEVELKTVGQEQGVCEKVGGCGSDDTQLDLYEIGEEIGVQASLNGGTLQLHECTAATLFTVSDTGAVNVATNNTVTASAAGSFPIMFVLGTAGDKCVLQHTPTGGTATDHFKIEPASMPENVKAAELDVTLTDNNGKLKVTLDDKPNNLDTLDDTVTMHVSRDSGATWGSKETAAKWGDSGFDSSLNWDAANEFGFQALLRVSFEHESDPDDAADTASNSNNAAYWSLHKAADITIEDSAAGITVGQVFKVTGLPPQDQNWSITKVTIDEACGLHFFTIEKSTSTNPEYDRPMHRINDKNSKDIPVAIPANETSFKVLAIDKQGGTGYTAGCKIKLNIRGAIIAVGAKVDTARPSVTGIGVEAYTTNNQSKFRVILPAWDATHGTKVASFYNVSTDGSVSWGDRGSAQWGQNNDSDNVDWGGNAKNNFALVQVDVGTAQNAKIWWYYAGAQ